jgi:hypothetical protein
LSQYDEVFEKLPISEARWLELAAEHELTVEEYKVLHRKAWESFTIPKHRMFMNIALEGMILRYKESKGTE